MSFSALGFYSTHHSTFFFVMLPRAPLIYNNLLLSSLIFNGFYRFEGQTCQLLWMMPLHQNLSDIIVMIRKRILIFLQKDHSIINERMTEMKTGENARAHLFSPRHDLRQPWWNSTFWISSLHSPCPRIFITITPVCVCYRVVLCTLPGVERYS